MSVFATLFKRTGAQQLTRQFGETIGYTASGSDEVEISAIVVRNEAEVIAEIGDQISNAMIISVRNESRVGVLVSDLNTRDDRFGVPRREGDSRSTLRAIRILSDANGMLRLLIQ